MISSTLNSEFMPVTLTETMSLSGSVTIIEISTGSSLFTEIVPLSVTFSEDIIGGLHPFSLSLS